MKLKYLILLILIHIQCFSQKKERTSLEIYNLKGPVKSIKKYSLDEATNKEFLESIHLYSKNGNDIKRIYFEKNKETVRVTDSIISSYDNRNRRIQYISHKKRSDNTYEIKEQNYTYDENCNEKSSWKIRYNKDKEASSFYTYKYNQKCKIILEKEKEDPGPAKSGTTSYIYDNKGRLTKQTSKYYEDEKPNEVKTYKYDEIKKKLTILNYNPRKKHFREKEIRYFDNIGNIIKIEEFGIKLFDRPEKEPKKKYFNKTLCI